MAKLNGVYSPTDSIKGFIPQMKNNTCEGSGDCSDCNLFDCYYNQDDDFEYEHFNGKEA